MRFHGHDYRIVGHPPIEQDALFEQIFEVTAAGQSDEVKAALRTQLFSNPRLMMFERDERLDPTACERLGACNTRDLRRCGDDEGSWWYLPYRVAPALGVDEGLAKRGKARELVLPEHVKESIRAHPDWKRGRDDLAIAALAPAFKLTYPVHVSEAGFHKVHYAPGMSRVETDGQEG